MNRPAVRALPAFALLALLAACKPAATPEPAAGATAPSPAAAPAPAPVVADPRGEVVAAMRKFWDLRSYHAAMHIEGPRGAMDSGVDFVAPDRYRMEAPGRGSQVIIGDTMYMDMGGRVTRVPLPAGTITQWRDPAKLADAETEMTVEAQGRDAVDGQPAKKYLVRVSKPKPAEMSVWIGDAGFPLQIATHNPMGDATIKYSRFDDPTLLVEAPK